MYTGKGLACPGSGVMGVQWTGYWEFCSGPPSALWQADSGAVALQCDCRTSSSTITAWAPVLKSLKFWEWNLVHNSVKAPQGTLKHTRAQPSLLRGVSGGTLTWKCLVCSLSLCIIRTQTSRWTVSIPQTWSKRAAEALAESDDQNLNPDAAT